MKIAILSDTHDNLANLKKAIFWIEKEKIKIILHCGDLASIETLEEILKNFSGKIYLVLGNMDKDYQLHEHLEHFDVLENNRMLNLKRVKIEREFGEIEINNKKIAFCHFPKIALELSKSQKYDLIFYGHTHKPWQEKIGKTKLVNPGNLAGLFFKATFAVYDTKTDEIELKILEKLI
jgi:putative phosphoesterase